MIPLEKILRERIRTKGPITFAEFMDVALYDPDCGYYMARKDVWGAKGDYITTLDFGGIFAEMLAKQFFEMWEALGRPKTFRLVEAGAGRGTLTDGILAALKSAYPLMYGCVVASYVEVNKGLHREEMENSSWHCALCELEGPFTGCVYSNELLDALPFHRVVMREDGLKEIFVGLDGDVFCDVEGEPSSSRLGKYFAEVGVSLLVGQKAEVSLNAQDWIKNASLLLDKGFLVTIDYGMSAAELFRHGRPGTLLCHYKHKANDMPYERVGEQDITAHVDFTAVKLAGGNTGLSPVGYCSQRNFLMGLGVLDKVRELAGDRPSFDDVAHNQRIKALIMPGGISDTMKVFVQGKGGGFSLSGFSWKNEVDTL